MAIYKTRPGNFPGRVLFYRVIYYSVFFSTTAVRAGI